MPTIFCHPKRYKSFDKKNSCLFVCKYLSISLYWNTDDKYISLVKKLRGKSLKKRIYSSSVTQLAFPYPLPLIGSSCLKHLKCRFKAIQGEFGRGASLTNKKHFGVQCIDILVIISFLYCVGIQRRVMHIVHGWRYSVHPQNFWSCFDCRLLI